MNRTYIIGFFILVIFANCQYVFAQKNDYVWLIGYSSFFHNSNPADTDHYYAGNVKLNFNYNPVNINFDSLSMNFNFTAVSFSDSNGNLLFYSNGIYVANTLGQVMENGESINEGSIPYQWGDTEEGEGIVQAIMTLPSVANPGQYYLIHSYCDTTPGTDGSENYITNILSTLVDMQADGGLGKVIYKNQPIFSSVCNGALTATRHGNARDWWIPIQKHGTNCFYMVLLDSVGFHLSDSACMGPVAPLLAGQDRACFSPDGSKFIYYDYFSGLSVYDFDRCTGTLSNVVNISAANMNLPDSEWAYTGVAVSPNSRFLYFSDNWRLCQLDLWSTNLLGSMTTVASLDGWYFRNPEFVNDFCNSQLGPDGKIYIGSEDVPAFNIVDSPDVQGVGCHVIQHYMLPGISWGPPNYPNYRLGALTQSQCDTLALATEDVRTAKEKILKIYPNPAPDYTIVDYGFTDWSKGQVQLQICNALGQAVYTQQLPMYSGFQRLDISNFASGMYTVFIKRNNGVVASGKVVKE